MSRTTDDLEERCRGWLRAAGKGGDGDMPATMIEREMALTLDHIDKLRRHDRRIRHELLERECDIETRITRLCPLPHIYVDPHWAARNKLINQLTNVLVRIEEHQHRAAVDYDRRMQTLHDRLMQLLNMREQLRHHDGHSEDTP